MKGVVFTEFMELVEEKFGDEVLEEILDEVSLESEGVYTAVGTYSYKEIISLVGALSKKVNIPVNTLVEVFGEHLVGTFVRQYPNFFQEHENCFHFMQSVDQHIHVEVRKIYPDADLPKISTELRGSNQLVVDYKSTRPFASLALGLMRGAAKSFKEDIDINLESVNSSSTEAVFVMTKVAS